MDRIFNPFFTTKDRGTGLGLAIVHQIADSLGGSITVANAAEGGATFSLCLPAEWNQEQADGTTRQAGDGEAGSVAQRRWVREGSIQ